jgi:MinD-like ATPase involved in chromosome partitioning or flagellar assembly
MTSTYTPEEAKKVIKAVTLSGIAVAIADMGIVSTAIEATALAKEVGGVAKKYPDNTIVQGVFSDEAIKSFSPGEAPKDLTPDNAAEQAIAAITDALATLQTKATPQEISEYKQFIYAVAERVANAAGSGLFGTGKSKVSATEAAVLAKLKVALSV